MTDIRDDRVLPLTRWTAAVRAVPRAAGGFWSAAALSGFVAALAAALALTAVPFLAARRTATVG